MPKFSDASSFPHPSLANEDGVVAVGGFPSPSALIDAYTHGIFPWPMGDLPLLWFSPDPRFVFQPNEVHLPKSLKKSIRRLNYSVTADQEFRRVIEECARVPRPEQDGTWITTDMMNGYTALHQLGYAHSIEVWSDGILVGGLYGLSFGSGFFGESMFSHATDASKIGFMTMVAHLHQWGFHFIDCQVHTDHLERFGAYHIPRDEYLAWLVDALEAPTKKAPWLFSLSPKDAYLYLRDVSVSQS